MQEEGPVGTERRSERFGGFSPTARDPWDTGRAVSTGKVNHEGVQDLFRAVNRSVTALGRKWHLDECVVVCECRSLACTELMTLSADDYDAARAHPAHFIVLPGHDQRVFERVVEQHDHYTIVYASDWRHARASGSQAPPLTRHSTPPSDEKTMSSVRA